jgi:hypothetical protein
MDGELLEKTKSIFGGVFPIWPRPTRSWNSSAEKLRNPFGEDADHPSRMGVLAWLRDRRKLLRRYRFLTIAARLVSSSLIASFISSRLCFGSNKASAALHQT